MKGLLHEPSDEWKNSAVNNKYYTESQHFWTRRITNRIWLTGRTVIKEQKKSNRHLVITVAAINSVFTMVNYLLNKR